LGGIFFTLYYEQIEFRLLITHKHLLTHTSDMVNESSSMFA